MDVEQAKLDYMRDIVTPDEEYVFEDLITGKKQEWILAGVSCLLK